ncbi:MAG TPA: hypothetical protein PKC49_06355 [Phycisphaerae bacterium]|nr:hypothetical protein [Phycisphaerae bacterium]
MKSGFIVVSLLLAVSVLMAFGLRGRYKKELLETQDLTIGLLYFLEEHEGRFPASEQEFLASSFVEHEADGVFRIRGRADSRYRRHTHGYPIRGIERFAIAWGADLRDLREDHYGNVLDAAGRKVVLVTWPSSPPSGKEYARMLVAASRAIRAETADQPPAGVRAGG